MLHNVYSLLAKCLVPNCNVNKFSQHDATIPVVMCSWAVSWKSVPTGKSRLAFMVRDNTILSISGAPKCAGIRSVGVARIVDPSSL